MASAVSGVNVVELSGWFLLSMARYKTADWGDIFFYGAVPVWLAAPVKGNAMTVLEVFAGVCGFKTVIKADPKEKYSAVCTLETGCPNLKKVGEALGDEPLDVMTELFAKGESKVITTCTANLPHVSCPVPAAILKALEVSVGLALPADPVLSFKE